MTTNTLPADANTPADATAPRSKGWSWNVLLSWPEAHRAEALLATMPGAHLTHVLRAVLDVGFERLERGEPIDLVAHLPAKTRKRVERLRAAAKKTSP
jgi:hypothetical protein